MALEVDAVLAASLIPFVAFGDAVSGGGGGWELEGAADMLRTKRER